VLAAARTYGIPPDFADWAAFERFYGTMTRVGALHTLRDIHWDLRPCPHFGTLEVRVMDAQPTLAEALALAALLRALVRFLQASRGRWMPPPALAPQPSWELRDNCFVASRDGLEARLTASPEGDLMPLRRIAAGLPYVRQRRLLRRSGSLPAVVAALARAFRADLQAALDSDPA
jgi:glutamate---cysteine ligase / carboxylate-amine ligase